MRDTARDRMQPRMEAVHSCHQATSITCRYLLHPIVSYYRPSVVVDVETSQQQYYSRKDHVKSILLYANQLRCKTCNRQKQGRKWD